MIRIITDSTSDLSREACEKLGVEAVPISVHFGSESFRDGIDITHAEFYRRLAQSETLPTTSQLNPDELANLFRSCRDGGDEVVGIFLSGDLSGTLQSAQIAREMAGSEGIYIVDSRNATFALGLLVERAAALRDQGMNAAELAGTIRELAGRLRLIAVVDTLKYLKMGGRISAATAMVGGILGISPIVAVEDGKVEAVGKARGRQAALRWIEERLARQDIDLSLPIAFGHSHCEEALRDCMEYFSALRTQASHVLIGSLGSAIGTHVGPGAVGLAYFLKK